MKHILINQNYIQRNRFMKGNQWEDHWNHRHIKPASIGTGIPKARIGKAVRLRQHHELVDCTEGLSQAVDGKDSVTLTDMISRMSSAKPSVLVVNAVECDPGLLQSVWLQGSHMS